jgi:hypothetical protein
MREQSLGARAGSSRADARRCPGAPFTPIDPLRIACVTGGRHRRLLSWPSHWAPLRGMASRPRIGRWFLALLVPAAARAAADKPLDFAGVLVEFILGWACGPAWSWPRRLRAPNWQVLPETFKGTMFLWALVACASIMPVEKLPLASWQTALGPGFLSAVFDNIPLTALARNRGGYDWGHLAYAMGFGGSMIGFSSSAGVALANMYPDAKSAARWRLHGWHVTVA